MEKEEIDFFELSSSDDKDMRKKNAKKREEDIYRELIKKGMEEEKAANISNKITKKRLKNSF